MECKLCGSGNILEVTKNEDTYYYCQCCNLIFVKENAIVSCEKEKQRYEDHDNTHDNKGYLKMFEKFITEVIEPYQDEINSILEFGCGPGPVLADLLEEKGFEVDKYDPYFFPEKIYQGQQYDLITSTEVFEHLRNPYQIIKELLLHISEGGYLAIMTSFHPGLNDFEDWWYPWDPTHITFYNLETFYWIAAEFDLKLVYEDGEKYCLYKKKEKPS